VASRRRRVLIIVQNLPVPLDRRVWLECQTLVAAGYGVAVICPKGPGDPSYEQLDGVHLYKYSPPPLSTGLFAYLYEFVYCWLVTAWLALRVFLRHGFDAIQACNPPDTFFALALGFKLLGTRFVYDQHDLCPEVYLSRFARPSRLLLGGLHALERATYLTANHVITVNESYRAIALARGRRPPESVTVVRTGPDVRMRAGIPQPELKRGRAFLACYVGVMGPQDGVDLLLKAVHSFIFRLDRRDCQFTLIGFGDCYQDLRAMSHRLQLDDWVTFAGRIDGSKDSRLAAYLSTADIGLCPDPKNPLNDISTMNKTLEYMAFGLPVLAFDLKETRTSAGGAAHYVRDNDVEAFAEALATLLDAPERRAEMGRLGRERVENALAWDHQTSQYVSVYERLVGR
jgi:glycosyltransferase involved in cell wall biosynthesis